MHIALDIHSNLTAKVANFIINSNWALPAILEDKFPIIARKINQTIIHTGKDKLIWKTANDGVLTLKETYHHLNPTLGQTNWGKHIWSSCIPPSKSFTTWRLIQERVPTDENLKSRGCFLPSICDLCKKTEETSTHLFLHCPFAVLL
ncbi:PREDICTED: uncharacterized protein LOC109335459 [Lupinus angustifolius]|uniref:uncharacterized protein LOC109335459 n=1 Tax=Lupinus angustifolius TaxID=3871 RepID=UPI00092FBC64|nr:PREDICTED: uncharacterized protein LOC109335459 [Lupinus angustifolius]